jgi:leader peptidase (prepilin peptidase)/N-methyltransferase
MPLIEGLQSSPGFLMFAVGVFGLCVGSFLNVVILRLPQMMARAWKHEARALLELPEVNEPPLSLWQPGSQCPACAAGIKPWHNIPLLGWLVLRGRCAACGVRISVQYPLIELVASVLGLACAWHFGWSVQLAPALVFSWTLLALTVIDLRTQLLPDDLTLPLLWGGLLLSLWTVFVPVQAAVIGAVAGYLVLWCVFQLFRLFTGKEGMGFGDFKLLAALGAWLGWQALPTVVLLSSVVGATVGIGLIVFRKHDRQVPIPFGPYLAVAGWLTLMFGDTLSRVYLQSVAP